MVLDDRAAYDNGVFAAGEYLFLTQGDSEQKKGKDEARTSPHSLVIIRDIPRQSAESDIRALRQDPFGLETFLPHVNRRLDLKEDALLVFDVGQAGSGRVFLAAVEFLLSA